MLLTIVALFGAAIIGGATVLVLIIWWFGKHFKH